MKTSALYFSFLLLIVIAVSFVPTQAFSADQPPDKFPLKDLKFNDVIIVLNRAVTWFYTIFLIVAVLCVILAAFYYLTAGSSPDGIKKATHMLVYAAIAIAVAMFSVGLRYVVEQLVGAPSSAPGTTSSQNQYGGNGLPNNSNPDVNLNAGPNNNTQDQNAINSGVNSGTVDTPPFPNPDNPSNAY